MTKIIAYCALLYGSDYLGYAIRSVIDYVQEMHIIYDATGHGSHGHTTERICPDTRWELINIASQAAGDKLRWHDAGPFAHEGMQREAIRQYAPDASCIIVVDSDEVYADGLVEDAIKFAASSDARQIRLPFNHLWRSFSRGFLHDPAYPVRVISPQKTGDAVTMPTDKRVWHFGYAQNSEIVRFKTLIHGHKGEFRRDVDWYNDVWLTNRQTDCHIVGSDFWNAEDVDLSTMPSVLNNHPYRNLKVIP